MPVPAPSLIDAVVARPWLARLLKPVANWYVNAAGYRQMGLRADDLICEEDERVLKALKRLSPKENYDRVYRLRRATQLSLQHKLLPKNEWTKPEEDVPYLTPVLKQVVAEEKERHALDTLEVVRRKGQH
ncbi:putative cytochrome b-c1 complex protein [Thermochaetoides thermophila DSM 1495]|uniref:Cytochrome b-c1 complex subunit 7 n=1 Tax=Chaetomium thermophilum (strain DSM 1495 / CBS 144.50 / IMI 039719) TaxID=759272 RepID=G0SEF3_CHATD|nr:putative cytochrome b-c1 complex protein [Thermochaetoides thermophila DSM 1495]EGS18330.1 putative cytochrome b-c1 complex protein [Thermochaetoides thermophila DSM 1495]